ncbi:M23 family metallopeptidase [Saccharopolyspora rosea]|uniref:M23 family metallopeptidase n=1 Tax=Saccharopolyspora rosea TaxID=524884 RepID=UPI0021DA3E47|nr:M23 family metallopeptidase [Saccharopolyspora rosea]
MRLLLPAVLCCAFLTWSAAPTGPAAPTAPPPAPTTSFGAPLAPPEVARPFTPPASEYGPGHRGVDLAATAGAPVLAAGAGLVRYAGRMVDRDVVSIEHPGGLRTTYEPVAPLVAVGDRVARGQPIGSLEPGHPGCPAAPQRACLHWGARRDAEYLDPLRLISGGRVRLLPW